MSKLAQSILIFSSRRFEKPALELQAEAGFSKRLELKSILIALAKTFELILGDYFR